MPSLNRRQTLIGSLAAGATLVLSRDAAFAADAIKLTLVLTNDIYKMNEDKGRGGFPRLAAAVKGERAKGGNVIFTHAGDMLSPSLMSGFDQGAHLVEIMNAFAPDAFAPGNHEFDFGKEVYFKRLGEMKFPVVAANMRAADGSVLPGHKDFIVLEKAGLKIAIVGAALETTPEHSSSGDIKFTSIVEAVKANAKTARAQGADIVLGLLHMEKSQRDAVMQTRACDVVITGHTHDVNLGFDGRVLTAESGEEGQTIIMIDLAIDVKEEAGKKVISWWPTYRIVDSATLTPDPDVLAIVKKYEDALSKELDVPVATLGVPLDSRSATVRGGEAAIGNLIADAMKAEMGADCAITNGGGIRANKQYPAGMTLTRRDILSELPFGNRTVVTSVTGKAIREALENGLSQVENRAGRFPHVSGLKVVASFAKPSGSRVETVEINGAPLDDAKTYKVATNDFMLRGGDGYTSLAGKTSATVDSGGKLLANDVMVYARKLGTVNAKVEGRVVVN